MRVQSLIRRRLRRGGGMVEAALILPLLFMFIVAMVLVGLAVFCYQQVAELAREGARYASVHGSSYTAATGNSVTKANIYSSAIQPAAVGLSAGSISYTIQWGTYASGSWAWTDWDSASKAPTSNNASGVPITNYVQVTVTYTWSNVYIYKVGTVPLSSSSTSTMPMSY